MKIKLSSLCKSFENDRIVLDDINFNEDICTLSIIGRSGCGKSTLLRIMAGLLPKTSGQVLIDDEIIEYGNKPQKQIGFVFQQNGLFSHKTALQNITLPLEKVHGYSKEKANDVANELLNRFELKDYANKRPNELSGGQKQRISIARAIAPRPKIILLDEPTSALDPEYTVEVLDMINELKSEKICFVIATHEMGFAHNACEHIAFISNGTICEYGNSKDLFSNPKSDELKSFLNKILEWKV